MAWAGTIAVMLRVRDSSLSSTQRLVVQAIALRCGDPDHHGTCFAGVDTLAADCGLSDRSVQQAIKALGPHGLRVLVAVPDQWRRTNVWTIDLEAIPMGEPRSPRTTFTPNDVHPTPNVLHPRVKDVHPEGEAGSPMGEGRSPEEKREEEQEEEREEREQTARATPHEVVPTPPPAADTPSAAPRHRGGDDRPATAAPDGGGDTPSGEARRAFTPSAVMPGASALVAAATELAQSSTAIPITLDRTARQHLAKLEAGRVTPDDLRAVWQWAAESEDSEAERLRGRGYHVEWRILAEGQSWAFRLGQARAWLGRGKRTAPETRARGKPDQPTSGIAGLWDRLRAKGEQPIDVEVTSAELRDHPAGIRPLPGPRDPFAGGLADGDAGPARSGDGPVRGYLRG